LVNQLLSVFQSSGQWLVICDELIIRASLW